MSYVISGTVNVASFLAATSALHWTCYTIHCIMKSLSLTYFVQHMKNHIVTFHLTPSVFVSTLRLENQGEEYIVKAESVVSFKQMLKHSQ